MCASQEIFSYIVQKPQFNDRVFLTVTNPKNMKQILTPMVNIKEFSYGRNFNLIINAFLSTNESQLTTLNKHVSYSSRCVYQNINYYVLPKYVKPEFIQTTLTETPIYHDVYSLKEDDKSKFKKLDFRLGSNVTRNI
jgi:hypothetical protein